MERSKTITLVTGANKGLGYETARQLIEQGHTVYVGARDVTRGQAAADKLGAHFVQLDVTDDASVEIAMGVIDEREGHLDVLVNNAGISSATADVNGPVAVKVFDTNAIGVIRVTQAALPLLRKSENPVVVNVSSALGSFWAVTNPERRQFHYPAIVYGASKAAVSMLTVQYAKALPEIKFNAVEPGFTATDLTPFSGAGQPVEKGAAVIVRMATIGGDGPTGTFQENEGELCCESRRPGAGCSSGSHEVSPPTPARPTSTAAVLLTTTTVLLLWGPAWIVMNAHGLPAAAGATLQILQWHTNSED
jgi:NAD(P)-dependent dehydrogenase (short-subunit alcohol dehydrogenase family)